MTVSYAAGVKTNRLNTVNDAINSKTYVAGSGAGSAGTLVIGTSALSGATGVLATIGLPNPACSVAGAVMSFLGLPISVIASGTGTAALAEVRNNAGVVIVSGLTVGVSGTDLIMSSTAITSGQTVQFQSGSFTTS